VTDGEEEEEEACIDSEVHSEAALPIASTHYTCPQRMARLSWPG